MASSFLFSREEQNPFWNPQQRDVTQLAKDIGMSLGYQVTASVAALAAHTLTPSLENGCNVVVVLDANATIANPTLGRADTGTVVRFSFIQDGTGGHSVSFGTAYADASSFSLRQGAGQASSVEFILKGDGTLALHDSSSSSSANVQVVPSVAALASHTLTPVLATASSLDVTLDANLTVANPTVGSTPTGTEVRFTLRQDSTGYRSTTWGANFLGVSNVIPKQGPGKETEYVFELNADGTLTLVSHSGIDTTEPISVVDYGAVPGADCYAAIQALLDSGRDAFFPYSSLQHYVSRPLLRQTSNQNIFAERGAQLGRFGGWVGPLLTLAPAYSGLPTVAALLTGSGVAGHFDGTSNYWLGLGDNYRVSLDGKATASIEFAVTFDSIASNAAVMGCAGQREVSGATTVSYAVLGLASGGQAPLACALNIGGSVVSVTSGSTKLSAATRYRCELTYDGSNLRLFLDGVLVGTQAATGTISQPLWCDWAIGKVPAFIYEGGALLSGGSFAIDGVRISDTCRHTAGFTPSGAKPAWDDNTVFLHNFDGETGQWSKAYSRGFYLEQQAHWILLRREFASAPATISGGVIDGLTITDGIATTSAIWAFHATDVIVRDVFATARVKLLDNCFNWTFEGGEISVPQGEREAIGFGNACGAATMDASIIAGGQYQVLAFESGVVFTGARMQPNSDTRACFVALGVAASDNPTLDIIGVNIDGETVVTGTFEAGIVACGMHTVNLVGGTWDVAAAAAPVGKFNGCSKVTVEGSFLKVHDASQEVFGKNGTCSPVTVYNAFKYPTAAPWSNTSGFVQVDDGASRTNFKGLSTTDTPAANLAGTAVCTGGSGASFSFNLATAEADASVLLVFTAKSSTGAPAAGSTRVKSYSIAAGPPTAVTVTLEADPGGGNTVTFSWVLVRA